jgi:glycosyltransferase 2 family protein
MTLPESQLRPGRATRSRWKGPLQVAIVLAALAFAGRALAGQWDEVRSIASDLRIDWRWTLLGSAIVLLTHASLVQAWRMLLAGWDSAPTFWRSARIWSISNFGKYVPGKVWSIGALSMLAGREGVSGVAAAGAAVLGTLLNIGTGFGIVALSGARVLGVIRPWMQTLAIIAAVCFVVGVLLLPRLLPPMLRWITRRRGMTPVDRHLSARTLWLVTGINAIAWLGYGLAFAAFSRGVTPTIAGAPAAFITAYTASYLWGYLWLVVPGGVGVRELALGAVLVALGMATAPEAAVLAFASRVWITILEIGPGLVALAVTPRPRGVPSGRAG